MSDRSNDPAGAPDTEKFLLRITGKGITFKRHIPGWLAAWVVLFVGEKS